MNEGEKRRKVRECVGRLTTAGVDEQRAERLARRAIIGNDRGAIEEIERILASPVSANVNVAEKKKGGNEVNSGLSWKSVLVMLGMMIVMVIISMELVIPAWTAVKLGGLAAVLAIMKGRTLGVAIMAVVLVILLIGVIVIRGRIRAARGAVRSLTEVGMAVAPWVIVLGVVAIAGAVIWFATSSGRGSVPARSVADQISQAVQPTAKSVQPTTQPTAKPTRASLVLPKATPGGVTAEAGAEEDLQFAELMAKIQRGGYSLDDLNTVDLPTTGYPPELYDFFGALKKGTVGLANWKATHMDLFRTLSQRDFDAVGQAETWLASQPVAVAEAAQPEEVPTGKPAVLPTRPALVLPTRPVVVVPTRAPVVVAEAQSTYPTAVPYTVVPYPTYPATATPRPTLRPTLRPTARPTLPVIVKQPTAVQAAPTARPTLRPTARPTLPVIVKQPTSRPTPTMTAEDFFILNGYWP